ncbi:MAG: aldehyde-activating protein [Pseudomonadota bacterium]
MNELKGGCHCGNISVLYRTGVSPEDAIPRACQCDFCRKHTSSAVSDPAGDLAIRVQDGGLLNRYQFGLNAADFLICRECGVYVAAFMPDPEDADGFATLMSYTLDERTRYPVAQPTVYDGEDEAGRRQRRRERWTPARLVIG